MKWLKMIYSNQMSTKEIYQQKSLIKIIQITLKERSKTTLL